MLIEVHRVKQTEEFGGCFIGGVINMNVEVPTENEFVELCVQEG